MTFRSRTRVSFFHHIGPFCIFLVHRPDIDTAMELLLIDIESNLVRVTPQKKFYVILVIRPYQ